MYLIENEKIGLRGLELEDAKDLHKEMNNANMTKFLNVYRPFSLGEEEEFVKRTWENRKKNLGYSFAVIDKEKKRLIGVLSLMQVDSINRRAELGAWISEEYWGKGLGTEAEKLTIKYGFKELNLNSIYARAYSFNERSIKAIKKIGMKDAGRMRKAVYRHGEYQDVLTFDILKEEFSE